MSKSSNDISYWIANYISNLIEIPVDQIDRDTEFSAFGLDSSVVISMTGELSDWLGFEIEPTIVYEYSSISALSENVAPHLNTAAFGEVSND